jgi:Uma2 family endonuclease
MATATEPISTAEATLEGHPVEITADQFFGMIEAGLFAPERRVFLWDGRIYEKMAKTVAHAFVAARIARALTLRLPEGWIVWTENPIRLDESHAPLPDIPVVRGDGAEYVRSGRHPSAADVGLIVEVAVTSLPRDLGPRAAAFARAMVPAYWVADAQGRRIIEHREPRPGGGGYAVVTPHGFDGEIPLVIDGREIAGIPLRELFMDPAL